ncbi:MAG: transposase [Chloroflexota bacterium]|nr:transposase [Chloroflexota bacterium]
MYPNYPALSVGPQASPAVATALQQRLTALLAPLLTTLDAHLDKRLVRTFLATIVVLLQWRYGAHGLLLSELGAYLIDPAHAPAGTKRLSNLLRSRKWSPLLIEHFLWQQANQRVQALEQADEEVLVVWDESVLEKPESTALEGLGPVRSSKAARLLRIKPGYYHPPCRKVVVPGINWLGLLVTGRSGPPTLAAMRWWPTRGPLAQDRRQLEARLLRRCRAAWGPRVLHLFDRGFAGSPWLGTLLRERVRFVLRWNSSYPLMDATGHLQRPGAFVVRRRSWEHRLIPDAQRRQWCKVGVLARQVWHPDYPEQPLWLVVARPGKGQKPWYLLTNEPVPDAAAVWRIVLAYARRWQIEQAWRFNKSDLVMESPRLWKAVNRRKFLLLVSWPTRSC